ncbi:hypothetical protein LX36DRAFT_729506 [Colletotrichum falcatum]|nr:hypothetical protein LX36DRAFT_729506 [Colletotrichum falcatum]
MTDLYNPSPLAVTADTNGQPMIFTRDDQGLLCLIVKEKQVSQTTDGTIHLVFVIKEDGKADQLFVLPPMTAQLDDWKALSGKDGCYTGPQWDITIREILLIHLVFKERKLTTEDIWTLTVNTDTKSWSNPFEFHLPINPNEIMAKCIGNLSMYRGMFVLYKSHSLSGGSDVSMRFVGLDPEEETPVVQSIDLVVPDGATQIATFDNADGLTDLLIAGKQLSWLSADACIQGRQAATVIDDSSSYNGLTQLQIVQGKDSVVVWSVAPSSAPTSQEFSVAASNTKPMKRTEATPERDQDRKSNRFALIAGSGSGQKTTLVTQDSVKMLLQEGRAKAHAPEIAAAREKYIGLLNDTIQLSDQLGMKMDSVNKTAKAAEEKLSEVYRNLEDHIQNTNIASTVGSAASILGVILLFTPAALIGVGLTVGGTGTSVGSSIAKTFFYEADASKAFTEVINDYNTSSKALEDLLKDIVLVHTYPFPDPSARAVPKMPDPPGAAGIDSSDPSYVPNQFSNIASKGLALKAAETASSGARVGLKISAELAELLSKNGGKVLAKALPMLGKAIPVLSIAIDVASILSTWTNSNETLQEANKLKADVSANAEAFRQTVKTFQSNLEEQIGNPLLQGSLKKLLRLGGSPPEPPMRPEDACKMIDQMKQMEGTPMTMFISYDPNRPQEKTDKVPPHVKAEVDPRDEHQQEEPDDQVPTGSHTVEMLPKADVLQLSQKPMCAPLIDLAYEQYPDLGDTAIMR